MHKKMEAELMSIAHSILQMKNRDDIAALHKKAQELHEKLAVLLFIDDYLEDKACPNSPTGSIDPLKPSKGDERRILKIIIVDCTDNIQPSDPVEVKGLGCFFLTQTMGGGNDDFIIGEFAYDCSSVGIHSGAAEDNPGPYTIVLYHVPGSKDS